MDTLLRDAAGTKKQPRPDYASMPDQAGDATAPYSAAQDSRVRWEHLSIEGKLERLRLLVKHFADNGKKLTDDIRIEQAMLSDKVELLADHTHNVQTGEVTVPILGAGKGSYEAAKSAVEGLCEVCRVNHNAAPLPEGFF